MERRQDASHPPHWPVTYLGPTDAYIYVKQDDNDDHCADRRETNASNLTIVVDKYNIIERKDDKISTVPKICILVGYWLR